MGGMSPQELITHFSTQAAAAKALGCAQSTVAEWCSDGTIPEGRQYQIELATAGALVAWTGSNYPDLIIGTIAGVIVLNGARRILALKD